VLGLFFLLVWITVIAALTGHERGRARLLLPSHVDDEFKEALSRNDHATLARYYRVALQRTLPARDEQLVRINLACALNGLGEHGQALEELDRIELSYLLPTEVALWLNNRAYTLVFLGRPKDALDNLADADDLLAGDDGLSRDPLLSACISGTRGIAQLHEGDIEGAERSLLSALRQEEEGVTLQFDPESETDPARTSERWYWLGEVSRRRGQLAEAERRLQRALAFPATAFGKRAAETLPQVRSELALAAANPQALPATETSDAAAGPRPPEAEDKRS
jgi:tetratricopeptide (TPR) repeat protein